MSLHHATSRALALRAVTATALALTVAACSSSAPTATAKGQPDGTLRIAIAQAETSLSVLDYDTHSFDVLDEIYEPLVRYGADGTIQPGLAESYQVSPDGLTMTFRLRTGVQFSDGTPFTAAVAKADLDRWVEDKANSFLGVTGDTKQIRAADDHTIVWTLKQPYYSALNELALVRPVRFVSPAAVNAAGKLTSPIGTGPFKVVSTDTTKTVLTRNDSYWGPKPSLKQLVFTVIPDSAARVSALKAGEVDVIGGDYLSPLALEDAATLRQDRGVDVLQAQSTTNLLLTYNADTGNRALASVGVRRAIAMALDRDAIASGLFAGAAQPATSVFPANVPYGPKSGTAHLDVDAAGAALDQAGWTGGGTRAKNGVPLTLRLILDPSSLPQATSLSQVVQAQLAKVGIAVTISSLDSTAYSSAVSARKFDLRFYSTYGAPYDPYSMLTANFRSVQAGHLFTSPQLDREIPIALAAKDDASRQAAYNTIWMLLDTQAAAAPIVQLPRLWAVRKAVKGFQLGATEYDLPLTGVSVA